MKDYPETHKRGHISMENMPDELIEKASMDGDFGIHIAEDGRVWVCIDGIAFIRFLPDIKDSVVHQNTN